MAHISYATTPQFEELMRDIRFPEIAARRMPFACYRNAPPVGGSVLRLIYTILAEADLDFGFAGIWPASDPALPSAVRNGSSTSPLQKPLA